MGKTFDKNKMNGFFSDFTQPTEDNTPNTHNKPDTQNKSSKPGRPPKPEDQKLRG